MDIGPHSEDEIAQAARPFLPNKSFKPSTAMVYVLLLHNEDGVNYGYDVYFKKIKKQGSEFDWALQSISNRTSS